MLRLLRTFIRRELVADVPAEMDLCLDCGKVECSEGEFQACVRRKARAAQLDAALAAPPAPQMGARRRARLGRRSRPKKRARRAVAKMKAPTKKRVVRGNVTPYPEAPGPSEAN